MEVEVAAGGRFHHIRAQGRDHERRAATHLFGRLASESLLKSFTLTANGALTRNDVVIELLGDDGVAHVAGAAVGDGAFHHDDTVFITHAGLRCESRQVFKKVLKNGAVGVFQGKILVKPGASLSLQKHHHRAEHWIVVSGTAEVTNGDQVILLGENQSTYIPLGQTHRLANPGKVPLEIIEVQSGSYLGEDDIVRFEDVYGR